MAAEAIPFKTSSHITGITYDEETNTLVVSFKNGSYEYSGVPTQVANGFADAPSAGQYLDQNIKNRYPYKRL